MLPDTKLKTLKRETHVVFTEHSLKELIGKEISYRGENSDLSEIGTIFYNEEEDCVFVEWEDGTLGTLLYKKGEFVNIGIEILEKSFIL
jgi:hypothetical protein